MGRENVEVYHVRYYALEEEILEKYDEEGNSLKDTVYTKAVIDKRGNKIVGLHYAGPNAGEIMQGFAVAMRMGLTKEILDETIGIHPVAAENITNMTVTK